MGDSQAPEIDVEELKARIRAEVAQRPKVVLPEITEIETDGFDDSGASAFDWQQIASHLAIAEENADVGRRLLPMAQFHPVVRWGARLIGKIVLYLGEVFTFQQRAFNTSLLLSARLMFDGARESREKIDTLETAVDRRFGEQGRTIDDMSARLGREMQDKDERIAYLEQTLVQLTSRLNFQEHSLAQIRAGSDRPASPQSPAVAPPKAAATPFDSLYGAFEDKISRKTAGNQGAHAGFTCPVSGRPPPTTRK